MSESERERWEQRYADRTYTARTEPSPFLLRFLPDLPPGRALDLACGEGRNALALAAAGYDVDAIDISPTAVARGEVEAARRSLTLSWDALDLDDYQPPNDTYDLITVIRYVNRSLWARLIPALRPGGALLIEHHLQTDLDVSGPQTDAFRLQSQELLRAFTPLRVVFYEETTEPADRGGGMYALARLVAFRN